MPDSEVMGTPQYTVKEVSDEEDNGRGALVPVVVKVHLSIQNEVGLSTVFNRLQLKRKCDVSEAAYMDKRQKGDLQIMSVDRLPLSVLNVNKVVVTRTRNRKGKVLKGNSMGLSTLISAHSGIVRDSHNLIEVPVSQFASLDCMMSDMGGGGGAVVVGLIPPQGSHEAHFLELSRVGSDLDREIAWLFQEHIGSKYSFSYGN